MRALNLLILLFVITLQQALFAQVIPASRRTNWGLAGYRDTIPTYSNTVNITSYGGSGNGIVNNKAALQSAIAALGGHSGNVYFPTGTYLFNSTVFLPDS